MKKIIILTFLTALLISCDFGPKAFLNDKFVLADPSKELPFEKLIGVYQLDKDSKRRYNINDNINLELILKDSTICTDIYISTIDHKLIKKNIERKIHYTNNFGDKNTPLQYIGIFNKKNDDFYSNIDIYYRKKDSALALYIFTPFIPATKENNMQYKEGDYLRYIKVR